MAKFHHVYIEILNYCQFNCSFCPKTSRAPQMMSPEQFEHILQEVKPYTSLLYLHVLGEPLLHPQLKELLSLAKHYGFKVNITTNGALLAKQGAILLESGVISKINISLHSMEDSGQKDLDTNTYLQTIFDFTKQAIQHNISIIYRLWDTNKKQNTILNKLQEQYPDVSLTNTISPQNGIRLEYRVFLHQENQFTWPIQSSANLQEGYCLGLKSHFAILADGTLIPCCLDSEGKIALGNLMEEALTDILNKPRTKAIIEGFQKHQAIEKLCQQCSYKTRFNHHLK